MTIDPKAVHAASEAILALVNWEFCDCGCPNQRSPQDSYAVDLLRLASWLECEFLPDVE